MVSGKLSQVFISSVLLECTSFLPSPFHIRNTTKPARVHCRTHVKSTLRVLFPCPKHHPQEHSIKCYTPTITTTHHTTYQHHHPNSPLHNRQNAQGASPPPLPLPSPTPH